MNFVILSNKVSVISRYSDLLRSVFRLRVAANHMQETVVGTDGTCHDLANMK